MVHGKLEMNEWCKFRWTSKDSSGRYLFEFECIRRKGHMGNHVSYPSGEEHFNDEDAQQEANAHAEHNRKSKA